MSSVDYKHKAQKYKSKFLALKKEYNKLMAQMGGGLEYVQDGGFLGKIVKAFKNHITNKTKEAVNELHQHLKNAVDGVHKSINNAADHIKNNAKHISHSIVSKVNHVKEAAKHHANTIAHVAAGKWHEAKKSVKKGLAHVHAALGNKLNELSDHIKHVGEKGYNAIHHATSSALHSVVAAHHHLKSVQHNIAGRIMSGVANITGDEEARKEAKKHFTLSDKHHKLHDMHMKAARLHDEAHEAHTNNAGDKDEKSKKAHDASVEAHEASKNQHSEDEADTKSHDHEFVKASVAAQVKAAASVTA